MTKRKNGDFFLILLSITGMPSVATTFISALVIPVICSLVALLASAALSGTCLPSWAGFLAFSLIHITCYSNITILCLTLLQAVDYIRLRWRYHRSLHRRPHIVQLVNLPNGH